VKPAYSIIVPVYNRPDEMDELLASLVDQDFDGFFEVCVIEDGSTSKSDAIIKKYESQLSIRYYFKENSGPGDSRNYGMRHAKGNYFIILDSDVILPSHYLSEIDAFLEKNYIDCFGGADAAHDSFTNLQKAINYTMTSFFTTGGIRGSKKSVQKFEPRSFNMGISRRAFEATKGFSRVHPGEDPDLSQRIIKAGFATSFLPNAYVYHKRRISWKKFYIQVKKFGTARPFLSKWHPSTEKITFWFPTVFVFFLLLSIALSILINPLALLPLGFYLVIILLDSTIKNKNLIVGLLSVFAVFVQFFGYGLAFLKSSFYIKFLGRDPEKQFPKMFFKA